MNWESIPTTCKVLRRNTKWGKIFVVMIINESELTCREIVESLQETYPVSRFYYYFE